MGKMIQAIRGMNDILPEQIPYWHYLENILVEVAQRYGYQEIRFPVVESTELFVRTIGKVTDIVEKEMYTFADRNGDSLTLRPEGTAGCIRACIQHGLLYNQNPRVWYKGSIFRHERPQKGRYRQFTQFGAEAIGIPTPDIDAELILMTVRFWEALGIDELVTLQLNSLGSFEARKKYRDELVAYFEQRHDELDDDSQRRIHSNPLRILDSKNPDMRTIVAAAPSVLDHLDDESRQHFDELRRILDAAGVAYEVNPRLVRGLDYYCRTVFEWVTRELGAQGTVCAGGRYDALVEQLGGKAAPAVGFALGLERIVLLLEQTLKPEMLTSPVDVYLIAVGEQAMQHGFLLTERLRNELPNLGVMQHCGGGSFKSQFKKADKSGASMALIMGEDEVVEGKVGIKFLREEKEQQAVKLGDIVEFLKEQTNEHLHD